MMRQYCSRAALQEKTKEKVVTDMRKNMLLKTNVFICAVIIVGFLATSVISYYSNNGIFKKDIEHISTLTSEGIYHQIDSIFSKPINISLTMANDTLLKTFLKEEETYKDEEGFVQSMKDYLLAYQTQYGYDSVFLVSAQTNRYYHYDTGVDRTLTRDDPENDWYFDFLEDTREYFLNIDNDEVQSANNDITIFIDCKIYSPDGQVMGVVGVGFKVDTLQKIFQEYEDNFQLRAYLIDRNGNIQVSTTKSAFYKTNLFDDCQYGQEKEAILSEQSNQRAFWYFSGKTGKTGFVVTRYIQNLDWYLLIENDTTILQTKLNQQFGLSIAVVFLVTGLVLLIITEIIRKYNEQIVSLTVETERKHRTIFERETEKLYENIYEIDITHNKAASEATEVYFQSLGVPKNMPYKEALQVIAREQIKEEYREGYIQTFLPENVLKAYKEGKESLRYDFMMTNDGGYTYYWIRITARIFYWKDDQSVRMLIYRQNIDSEKQQELKMTEKMMRDSLSGLYNKASTQELIERLLSREPGNVFAFFILDIDNFKNVNDTLGHAVGDHVITDFGKRLKEQFREEDIVGRIGGDEFVVFVSAMSRETVEKKAGKLAQSLQYEFSEGNKHCGISASIGVAVAPQAGETFEQLYKNADKALYQTKERGKKGYTIFQE